MMQKNRESYAQNDGKGSDKQSQGPIDQISQTVFPSFLSEEWTTYQS